MKFRWLAVMDAVTVIGTEAAEIVKGGLFGCAEATEANGKARRRLRSEFKIRS